MARPSFNLAVARLTKMLSRRTTGSTFLETSPCEITPGTIDDALRGLIGDLEEDYLPAKVQNAKGHGTEDQPVINVIVILETLMSDFSHFFPALSAFLFYVHHDESLSRI